MTDKQNLAEEMPAAWQNQLQDYFKDPRIADLLVENYAKFQKNFKNSANSPNANQPGSSADVPDDVNLELRNLKEHVESLESRIKLLEKYITRTK